ncbi:unnamed protein product [Rotaria sp. Silwood1]|nr:unnamed protein product [Rotaria sp. Silwood1]
MTSKHSKEQDQYQLQCISDVQFESGKLLLPIEGYEKMKLVSLQEAIVPLYGIVPDIHHKAYIALQRCQEPKDGLSSDESASIFLYTMRWSPNYVYHLLNETLRTEQRELLRPWFLFLKFILTALWKLPSITGVTLFRGVKLDLSQQYTKGRMQPWWEFSSTTTSVEVLQSPQFLGKSGVRTLFTIDCCLYSKSIRNHSYYALENELLLLPARQFEGTGILDLGNDLYVITLKEVQPPISLLEPLFISTESACTKKPTTNPAVEQEQKPKSLLVQLRQLFISAPNDNEINVETKKVYDLMAQCKTATKWNLKHQQLIDADMKILANELKTNTNCKELILQRNEITSKGAQYLAEMLKVNCTLQLIWLGWNEIGDKGVRSLCEGLQNNRKNALQELGLGCNKITDKSVNILLEMVKVNSTLTHMTLGGVVVSATTKIEKITDNGNEQLEGTIFDNKELMYVSDHHTNELRTYLTSSLISTNVAEQRGTNPYALNCLDYSFSFDVEDNFSLYIADENNESYEMTSKFNN